MNEKLEDYTINELGFCGCGDPELALKYIGRYLQAYKDTREGKITYTQRDEHFTSEGEMYFFLYWADSKELMEHGTSVWSGWLTEKGEKLLQEINNLDNTDKN